MTDLEHMEMAAMKLAEIYEKRDPLQMPLP